MCLKTHARVVGETAQTKKGPVVNETFIIIGRRDWTRKIRPERIFVPPPPRGKPEGIGTGMCRATYDVVVGESPIDTAIDRIAADLPHQPNEIGRRDWTRTNDPHHVKVVL